jgi:RHS repeat-associated protein
VERRSLVEFPNVNFSDPHVKWADMTGDGLQDIVLVYEGNVHYWPNLGYGNWAKGILMRNSPRLPFGYDPKRILIGDIDGDGLADFVYIDDNKVTLWINQSGNGWSNPIEIKGTPPVSDIDAVRLADMLGSGISGVLWSADANGAERANMRFLDFTGGVKPYLLTEMSNNIGSVTRVDYAPSTRFYLEDEKRSETRWKTPLPFPVQVVARVEVIDALSGGKLTTQYSYHHGYWDGAEREFRGFGRVDQRDTETFEDFNANGLHPAHPFERVGIKAFSPPAETRTWFHQGPIGDEFGEWQETNFSNEFYSGDPQALERPIEMIDALKSLPRRARRDALRSLRGSILRTELYALDGTGREDRPYTVTESLYGAREEDPPSGGEEERGRIFFPHALAQRVTQWERGDDPMTQFTFTDDYDAYGQPRSQIAIAVPRGRDFKTRATQGDPYLATHTITTYANRDDSRRYIIGRVARATSHEIINDGSPNLFALRASIADSSASRRIISQTLNFYDGAAFHGLPFGQIGDHGVVARTENLVLTEQILQEAYKSGGTAQTPPEIPPYLVPGNSTSWTADYPQEFQDYMPPLAGYIYQRGGTGSEYAQGYFAVTERRCYDCQGNTGGNGRGLLLATRDSLGHDTTVIYDAYDLLPVEITDPAGLTTKAKYNYRVLQPVEVMDPNGNRTVSTFTPLGLLATMAVMGKEGENAGDTLEVPGSQLVYNFLAFAERGQPISVRTIRRAHHVNETDVALPGRNETIETIEYSDGFGRLLQTRTHAEETAFGDSIFGDAGLAADRSIPLREAIGQQRAAADPPRVVVSGWQIYDNKGRVVEKYEPFFSVGFGYAPPTDVQFGQKTTVSYDPRGQVVRTVNPDSSEQRIIFGVPVDLARPEQFIPTPWEAYTYDANDNAGRTHQEISTSYRNHWNTPASIVVDALGRTVLGIVRNGPNPDTDWFVTRSTYDIQGNLLTVTDALERVAFKHAYDLAGHLLRTESIDAGVRRTILNVLGNAVEECDSRGALILHAYDILHRLIRLWARDGNAQPLTLRERLIYGDASDSGVTPAQAIAVNLLGKLYRHYDEAGLVTIESYDFKANALEKVQQVISDTAILDVFNAPPADWHVQSFRVDWQPPAGMVFADRAQQLLDATLYRTSLTHDALNRVKSMRYPQDVEGKRKELQPRYNRAGALERVQLDDKSYVEHIAYNAKGQRALIIYGNGVMTRHAYDPKTFRLARLRTERYITPTALTYRPTGAPLQDFVYQYDLVGNITTIQDRTPDSGVLNTPLGKDALDRAFMYDPLYRLLSATGRESDTPPPLPWGDPPRSMDITRTQSYIEQYQYDRVGNLTHLQHQSTGSGAGRGRSFVRDLTLAAGSNRLSKVTIGQTDFDYAYDANGNLIRETASRQFEWDYADHMRVFRTQAGDAEPSVYAHYLYNAGGQRVKKLVRKQGGKVEVTVYVDGIFEHQRIVQGSAMQENNTLHVMDNQSRIALVRVGAPFPDDTTPTVKFHLSDHLGSSNLVLDDSGSLVNREEYMPYGETSFGSFAKKRYRFTGKERDEESGLSYHGARYYAAWLGRWSNCDPLGTTDGLNLYRFARNNPVRFSDPSGTDSADSTQKCPGGKCHAAATGPSPSAEFPPLSQEQIQDWFSGPPPEEPALPTTQEQGEGQAPSRFNIQCVGNCHDPSKVQGNWTGMGPAPDHPTPLAAKPLIAAVAMLPGPGTLLHVLTAVNEAEQGKTGAALWSLGNAALTLAPLTSLRGGAGAPVAATRDIAPPPVGPGFKVGVKFTEKAFSFNTVTDAEAVRKIMQEIESKYPGAAVYIGSGGHGNRFGSFFAKHPAFVEHSFFLEDVESIRALRELGVGKVLDLSKPGQLNLFRNAEKMARTAGQDHVFTIRAWCFSSRSTF